MAEQVAPILAAWVHAVAPDAAPVLLETLVLQTHGASDKVLLAALSS